MMKSCCILLLALSLLASVGSAQEDPHVHIKYNAALDKTIVRTDWMHLADTPQQFLQLIFNASYKGKELRGAPEKVDLVVYSFSKETIYKEGQKLLVKTVDESFSLTPQSYAVFKGETRNGQDIFWEQKRVTNGQPNPFPKNAQVRSVDSITGLFMEQLYFQLKREQFIKLATSKSVELQLGASSFSLMTDYRNTARNFLGQIDSSYKTREDLAAMREELNAVDAQRRADLKLVNGQAVSLPQPRYPFDAKNAKASGVVRVLVTIDETGKVVAAQAIDGHPLLRAPAEEAARAALFKPPSAEGKPVRVTGIILYNFVN